MKKKVNILYKLGFSDREVKVYMAGLALGPASASEIAGKAGISRTLVYDALERLLDRGLVSKTGVQRKTKFIAEPVEAISSVIARKRAELDALDTELPKLFSNIAVTTKGPKAHIRVYQGLEGVKVVAEDVLTTKSKIVRSLVPLKNVLDTVDREYIRNWFKEIDRRDIRSRSLWSAESRDPAFATRGRELRLTPEGMEFPATMMLYDDTAALFSMNRGKPTTLVIENREFAETLTAMFDRLWQQADSVK